MHHSVRNFQKVLHPDDENNIPFIVDTEQET
ncbi:hypothetical protein T06_2652 [Trichinella sp. T6]|nr:hypothetical protein T06_7583 [Trichinella sp. T6]KRX51251.1 hypothetical protein T06_272 [Trichinella sp. T6]KRX52014.1 hypothetical protein T06_2652 [Trichinella sp. T6]